MERRRNAGLPILLSPDFVLPGTKRRGLLYSWSDRLAGGQAALFRATCSPARRARREIRGNASGYARARLARMNDDDDGDCDASWRLMFLCVSRFRNRSPWCSRRSTTTTRREQVRRNDGAHDDTRAGCSSVFLLSRDSSSIYRAPDERPVSGFHVAGSYPAIIGQTKKAAKRARGESVGCPRAGLIAASRTRKGDRTRLGARLAARVGGSRSGNGLTTRLSASSIKFPGSVFFYFFLFYGSACNLRAHRRRVSRFFSSIAARRVNGAIYNPICPSFCLLGAVMKGSAPPAGRRVISIVYRSIKRSTFVLQVGRSSGPSTPDCWTRAPTGTR